MPSIIKANPSFLLKHVKTAVNPAAIQAARADKQERSTNYMQEITDTTAAIRDKRIHAVCEKKAIVYMGQLLSMTLGDLEKALGKKALTSLQELFEQHGFSLEELLGEEKLQSASDVKQVLLEIIRDRYDVDLSQKREKASPSTASPFTDGITIHASKAAVTKFMEAVKNKPEALEPLTPLFLEALFSGEIQVIVNEDTPSPEDTLS